MKKTCNGCKALGYDMHNGHYCALYFSNKEISYGKMVPIENCPKPKNMNDYMSEREKINERLKAKLPC